jgi:DNA-binding MarR family transcriptional regulator
MEQESRALASSVAGSTQQDLARQFGWEIVATSMHLQEIRNFWARAIGVSGPQWTILTALSELDKGEGVPVKAVAKMLHVDSSFVTAQSKLLEKKGYVRRKTSGSDARVVQMSLSDKSCKQFAGLSSQQEELNNFIFGIFSDNELSAFTDKLVNINRRLEKARLKVKIDV